MPRKTSGIFRLAHSFSILERVSWRYWNREALFPRCDPWWPPKSRRSSGFQIGATKNRWDHQARSRNEYSTGSHANLFQKLHVKWLMFLALFDWRGNSQSKWSYLGLSLSHLGEGQYMFQKSYWALFWGFCRFVSSNRSHLLVHLDPNLYCTGRSCRCLPSSYGSNWQIAVQDFLVPL